ncbi:hypothetical protein SAMN05421850_102404 [Lutimaribacter saemankumensis]|uniref:Uncharacterized protein n=1 Tax=Lutimaribacter saemankumensis TaxID=490829 RepID=A0A1G8K4W2_9RHOB|nr:hypothetical protein SAMN05421850_102404 [Lutimaribacter saemankumensis]
MKMRLETGQSASDVAGLVMQPGLAPALLRDRTRDHRVASGLTSGAHTEWYQRCLGFFHNRTRVVSTRSREEQVFTSWCT